VSILLNLLIFRRPFIDENFREIVVIERASLAIGSTSVFLDGRCYGFEMLTGEVGALHKRCFEIGL
jgi:hypothetical protein